MDIWLEYLSPFESPPRREGVHLTLAARDSLPNGNGDVRLAIDPGVPALRADAAQLEQVFLNLLENARRYSKGRPVTIHARQVGERVMIRVVDQGVGIGPGERERIFEPFYRGRQPHGDGWTGSGLGLAIAKGFVEANGGRISVQSLPGQGTTFTVELPA